jgi:hypothetical protein
MNNPASARIIIDALARLSEITAPGITCRFVYDAATEEIARVEVDAGDRISGPPPGCPLARPDLPDITVTFDDPGTGDRQTFPRGRTMFR